MSAPRFSVIVPTRDRPETLHSALLTCLHQEDYDDYEVLVCDNDSREGPSRAVVERLACPRLRYVRAPRSLAMSANWDLALRESRGDNLLYIGDDDGLMPYALRELDGLQRHSGMRAIRWDAVFYCWPSVAQEEARGLLTIPTARTHSVVNGHERIEQAVARCELILPQVYHGCVSRALLEEARAGRERFFEAETPDIYSGFVVAARAGAFLEVTVPMTVVGISARSNGAAHLFAPTHAQERLAPIIQDFASLNQTDAIPNHPWVPRTSTLPAAILDAYLLARARHFPHVPSLVDRRQVVSKVLATLHDRNPQRRRSQLEAVRASVRDDEGLLAWFEAEGESFPTATAPRLSNPRGFVGDGVVVDSREFGVTDVQQAAALATKLLSYRAGAIHYDLHPRAVIVAHDQRLRAEAQRARAEVVDSLSWRLTAPVRMGQELVAFAGRRLRRLRGRS